MSNAITVQPRTPAGKVGARAIRRQQQVPGVLYGDHIASRHFSIAAKEIPKLRKAGGSSGLIDVALAGEDKRVKAIVQHVERDAVSGEYEHIDLYQVRMDRKLHTSAHLEFVGESSAVKDLGGILIKQHTELPIECLPSDLVNRIDVSIEPLKMFEDAIRVKDLQLPQGVATPLPADEIIAAVSEPRSEEELKAELEAVVAEGAGPEVLTEKKKDEALSAGAEAAAEEGAEAKKEKE